MNNRSALNSTITSFVPNYRDSETFGGFSALPGQMNQTVTEGFGVGKNAGEFDLPGNDTYRGSY
jgi:hypothetical protein